MWFSGTHRVEKITPKLEKKMFRHLKWDISICQTYPNCAKIYNRNATIFKNTKAKIEKRFQTCKTANNEKILEIQKERAFFVIAVIKTKNTQVNCKNGHLPSSAMMFNWSS